MSDLEFYDIALSFAGEDRSYADALANALRERQVTVFYDEFERAKLLGRDLYDYLLELYQYRARHAVVFISESYLKPWTEAELRAINARVFRGYGDYVLPIRLDDADVPTIPITTGHMRWPPANADSAAELILQKLLSGPITPPPIDYPDRVVFGKAVTDWAPLEGGGGMPIRHRFLTTSLLGRFVELPSDLRALRDQELENFESRRIKEGSTIWNGQRYALSEFHRTREGLDEEVGLHFKFLLTDYAAFQATARRLDQPDLVTVGHQETTIRQKYFKSFDRDKPNQFVTHSFGIDLCVITSDNRMAFVHRSMNVANKPDRSHIPMNEGMQHPRDLDEEGNPSFVKTAINGLKEELDIDLVELGVSPSRVEFLNFGALASENEYALLGRVRVPVDSRQLHLGRKHAKDGELETTSIQFTDHQPDAIMQYVRDNGPWTPNAIATIYYSMRREWGGKSLDSLFRTYPFEVSDLFS